MGGRTMTGQQVVLCPQCGGNKVKSNAKGTSQALLIIGAFFCITIIGIPFGIGFIVAALMVKKSKLKLKFLCQECKHEFKVSEDTFETYQKQIS